MWSFSDCFETNFGFFDVSFRQIRFMKRNLNVKYLNNFQSDIWKKRYFYNPKIWTVCLKKARFELQMAIKLKKTTI